MVQQIKKYDVGQIFKSKKCGKFKIIEKLDYNKRKICFIKTGSTKIVTLSSISIGSINDPLFPTIAGVGFIGEDFENMNLIKENKKAYCVWKDMISRCYSVNYKIKHDNNYSSVTVCEEWFNFSNFYKWFEINYIDGYQLDKDLLNNDSVNKIYSPETCIFYQKR